MELYGSFLACNFYLNIQPEVFPGGCRTTWHDDHCELRESFMARRFMRQIEINEKTRENSARFSQSQSPRKRTHFPPNDSLGDWEECRRDQLNLFKRDVGDFVSKAPGMVGGEAKVRLVNKERKVTVKEVGLRRKVGRIMKLIA